MAAAEQGNRTLPHAQQAHLDRAPITEAVVDVRVQLEEGTDIARLSAIHPDIPEEYAQREEMHLFQGEFQFGPGSFVSKSGRDVGVTGYRFNSRDEKKVVQMRFDGFTFSRLAPYTSWEDVVAEARRNWSQYLRVAPVKSVVRIAVRYINNFVIPAGRAPAEYLALLPPVPEEMPAVGIKSSLTRLHLNDSISEANCIVTQGFEQAGEAGTTVVIDIDVFRSHEFGLSRDDMWTAFEELRKIKNRIFFSSITDLAVRDFQ